MSGFAFPMRFGPLGHLARVEGARLYADRLRALVLRRIGESPFREHVGVPLSDKLFAHPTPSLARMIAAQVREAVVRYEPGVSLISVRVTPTRDTTLRVEIAYAVRATTEEGSTSFDMEV